MAEKSKNKSDDKSAQDTQEFEKRISVIKDENEKQIKYIRQVGDMQKNALEKKIDQLEKELRSKDEENSKHLFDTKLNEIQQNNEKQIKYIR